MLRFTGPFTYGGNPDEAPHEEVNISFEWQNYGYNFELQWNPPDYAITKSPAERVAKELAHRLAQNNYQLEVPWQEFLGKGTLQQVHSILNLLSQSLVPFQSITPVTVLRINVRTGPERRTIAERNFQVLTLMPFDDGVLDFTKEKFLQSYQRLVKEAQIRNERVEGSEKLYPFNLSKLKEVLNSNNLDTERFAAKEKGYILKVLGVLLDPDENRPRLRNNLGSVQELIYEIMQSAGIGKRDLQDRFVKVMQDNFDSLFEFPLDVAEVEALSVAGRVTIQDQNPLPISTLDTIELAATMTLVSGQPLVLRADWDPAELNNDSIGFDLTANRFLALESVREEVDIQLLLRNGTVLYHESFPVDDPQLARLNIDVRLPAGVPVRDLANGNIRRMEAGKRLRGQVIQMGDRYDLNERTVFVEAIPNGEQAYRIVASTRTDSNGNFTMDYPYGVYTNARITVDLMPDAPAILDIVARENPEETIADDFIYLLLREGDVAEPPRAPDQAHSHSDDCGCDTGSAQLQAKRLPDQADLINSDEYTQDIGGGCINLSRPNRSLREYNYSAIVRTSDPLVANYELEREVDEETGEVTYNLSGGERHLVRGEIDIDNPVRWQDAPEDSSNLALYQAVTIATGHILHYRSVFKADGYSLGELIYSLPLAPGQKKQIVVFESSQSLRGSETQSLGQRENFASDLQNNREILDEFNGLLTEEVSGRSRSRTSGVSGGLGVGAMFSGVGISLGVSGGTASANSSSSQEGARNISQAFEETLRQHILQSAESFRELNSSVVTSVTEGQDYGVTTEVVANHNHCHSLTMMYFEVLRHFAISQELVQVEECVFVPLMMTDFSVQNIHKWKDVLATNLLPIPSNTSLYRRLRMSRFRRTHPLLRAFDAIDRINSDYSRVNFPEDGETYADGTMINVKGHFKMRINLPRPKTMYDRIQSFPLVTNTTSQRELDVGKTIKRGIFDSVLAVATGGLSLLVTGPPGPEYRTVEQQNVIKENISDALITLDANYASVRPARAIRVKTFKVTNITFFGQSFEVNGPGIFDGNEVDRQLWETYARMLGYTGPNAVYEFLDYYFANRLISEWDRIFYEDIAPLVVNKIIDNLDISWQTTPAGGGSTQTDGFNLDFSTANKYRGGERVITVNFQSNGNVGKVRSELPTHLRVTCGLTEMQAIKNHVKLLLGRGAIDFETEHFTGTLYRGSINDDLLDGSSLYVPLNHRDRKNPRQEDLYLSNALIEHLNSNLEHYNKVLWRTLDPDRRFMLLDGFNIEVYNRDGQSQGYRSLASVLKNKLIDIAGNSLVFPVAPGYRVDNSRIMIDLGGNVEQEVSLLDHYRPLTPPEPYRISLGTPGVFMEAVQGNCDACEMVKENSSQDWTRFTTDEPTSIAQVITPTPAPSVTDYQPNRQQLAQPLVGPQTAPALPDPGLGLAAISALLGQSGNFQDAAQLAGTQKLAGDTYKSNQAGAIKFAEMAKEMAMLQHNTQNAEAIQENLQKAKDSGAITDDQYQELTRKHLERQISGGASTGSASAGKENTKPKPSLTDAAVKAAGNGQPVKAERTDATGTSESVSIGVGAPLSKAVDVEVVVGPITQPLPYACWATAATILVNWKNKESNTIESVLRTAGEVHDPANPDFYVDLFVEDKGMLANQVAPFIASLGMTAQPPASYDLSRFIELLENYGPLWIIDDAGAGTLFSPHARVLVRIQGDPVNKPNDAILTFVDPADGGYERETFSEFIGHYERMVTEIPADQELFLQVIHFSATRENRSEAPAVGQSAPRSSRIRVRNRIRRNDVMQGTLTLDIVGQGRNYNTRLNPGGNTNLQLTGFPDGEYTLTVNSNPAAPDPLVWTALGQAAVAPTTRIWENFSATVRLTNGRITASDDVNLTVAGRNLTLSLLPLWWRSTMQKARPAGTTIDTLVIHHTAGTNDFPIPFHAQRDVSVHYVIARNGQLLKLVHDSRRAAHAGVSHWRGGDDLNDRSIGIEIVHLRGDYPEAQYVTLIQLVADILAANPGITVQNVVGHGDIAHTNRVLGRKLDDPGELFNWPRLERANLCLAPTDEDTVFPDANAIDQLYGGAFAADKTRIITVASETAAPSDAAIIQAINQDLSDIGYLIGNNANLYSTATGAAVLAFKKRYFSGERRNNDSAFYSRALDLDTAKMLRRVAFTVANLP